MADKEKDSIRCQWDGEASTWPDYVRRVRLAYERTRRRRRPQLGPELVSQLSGKAWIVMQEIDHRQLTTASGAFYLIQFLEERLARVPIPDAGTRAEDLLLRLRRPPGMNMSSWCHTVRECYRKLQRALKRARGVQPTTSTSTKAPGPAASTAGDSVPMSPASSRKGASERRKSKSSVPEPAGEAEIESQDPEAKDPDPDDEHDDYPKGWGKGKWKGSRYSSSEDEDDELLTLWDDLDQGLPEVLPTELIGWIMLRKSSLSAAQRLNVLSSIGNSLKAEDVERGLRGAEDELHLVEREREGKAKGGGKGKHRTSFWVEQEGEWGLMLADDAEAEDILDHNEIHWLHAPIHAVLPSATDPTSFPAICNPTSSTAWHSHEEVEDGFWANDPHNPGAYLWWSMEDDGEYYHMDQAGTYWSWSESEAWQDVMWSASPEESKQIQEAYSAYEDKIRTFTESRRAMAAKASSRGFYPKGKGKGKFGKKGGKGKYGHSKSSAHASTPVMAVGGGKPGSPSYTGCFICGAKDHDFRSCPKRSRGGKGIGGIGNSKVFMVQDFDLALEETYTCHPISNPEQPLSILSVDVIRQPDVSGYGVLDTGATETVAGLSALENIMLNRKKAGIDLLHFEVVNCPNKTFKFGNGMSQQSESMVLLPQRLGSHLLSLGIFTLEAEGVPVLVGIRTLSRLGALIDCSRSAMIFTAIDPTLLVPLKQSSSGHLLLDLAHDWLADGAKILFSEDDKASASSQYVPAAASCYMVEDQVETPGDAHFEGEQVARSSSAEVNSMPKVVNIDQILSQEEQQYMSCLPEEQVMPFLSDVFAVRVCRTSSCSTSSTSSIPAQEQDMSLRLLALLANSSSRSVHSLSNGILSSEDIGAESLREGQGQSRSEHQKDELPRQVRRDSSCGPRSPRSTDHGSAMLWKPRGSSWWTRLSDGLQWSCSLGRMSSLQTSLELHSGVRGDRTEPFPRPFAGGYQPGDNRPGCGSSIQPPAEEPSHRLDRRREVLGSSPGEHPGSKGSSWVPEADARQDRTQGISTSSTTRTSDVPSPASSTNLCGHSGCGRTSKPWLSQNSQSRPSGSAKQQRRVGSSNASYTREVMKVSEDDELVKDVDMTDYNLQRAKEQAVIADLYATYEAVPTKLSGKRADANKPAISVPDGKKIKLNDLEEDMKWEDDINFTKLNSKDHAFLTETLKDLQAESDEIFSAFGGLPHEEHWDVLELCCCEGSLLTAYVHKLGGKGGRAGLFNQCDLTKAEGVDNVRTLIKKHRPRWIWVSFPCGPLSPVQALNEITEEGKIKSKFRKRAARKVLKGGLQILREHVDSGGEVAWEWPRYNRGWSLPEVQDFWFQLQQQGRSHEVLCDGCMVGLSCQQGPVRKPWRFMTTHPTALQGLYRQCDGQHHHIPCLGTNAKNSAFYTPELCRLAVRGMLQSELIGGVIEDSKNLEVLESLTPQELQHMTESVRKLHRLCGHPNNRALMKLMKARGADEKMLAIASQLKCPDCVESQTATPLTKVALEKEDVLWRTLQMDSFYMRHKGWVHHFLLLLDEASSFGVVKEIKCHVEEESENISTAEVLGTLEESWCQYFGLPARIRCDAEGAFRGLSFSQWCSERGIDLQHTPAEHHSTTGDVERAIGSLRWKMETFLRNEPTSPKRAAHAMMQAHNHVARVGGYSPSQWALGRSESAPESIPLLCSQGTPGHVMQENLRLRLEAEHLHAKLSAEARISRAMNSRSKPVKQFLPGDLVYYQRHKVPRRAPSNIDVDAPRMRIARWFGPARVLACETRVDDQGTSRMASSVVWLVNAGRLLKAHGDQLRHCSERESLIANASNMVAMPWTFSMLSSSLNKGAFEDLTSSKAERFERRQKRKEDFTRLPFEKFPERIDEEMAEQSGSDELIPDDQDRSALDPIPGLHPDEAEDIDIERFFSDPTYMPLKPVSLEPAVEPDFKRARREHEMDERPLHVKYPPPFTPAAQEMISWCSEETHDFVLGVTIEAPCNEDEWRKILKDPAKFSAKSIQKGAEISWHKLNETQRAAMQEAKMLEVNSWLSNKVVERAGKFVPRSRLMKMRWVLVLKSAGEEGKVKAKARIVILGYSDPEGELLDKAAPTLARRSKHLVLNLATHRKWKTLKADAKAAFLQGSESQRARGVFAMPVEELRAAMNIPPQEAVQLLRAAYGLVSAPREWYHDVDNIAQHKCGLSHLICEPCIWVCKDKGSVVGVIASHVDDFIVTGDESNQTWMNALKNLYTSLQWSPWEPDPYEHCGIHLQQTSDFGFQFDHEAYCQQIKQISVDKNSEEITADELSQARAVLGAIQWRVQQTAPQHAAKLSLLQSTLPNGSKDVLHQINKLVREVYAQKSLSISVQQLDACEDKDLVLIGWTDAAVANRPDMSSTGAYVIGLSHSSILDGVRSPVNIISWKSGKLPRVARSSLSAEVQALAEGEQELMFCRALFAELLGHSLDLRVPEEASRKVPGALVIDAKSVFDAFHKGAGASAAFSMKDKYAALELLALSENMRKQDTALLWVSSDAQLADGLTKASAQDAFKAFMMKGQKWNVRYDPGFIAAKKKKMLQPETTESEFQRDLTWRDFIARQTRQETGVSSNFFGASEFSCFSHVNPS